MRFRVRGANGSGCIGFPWVVGLLVIFVGLLVFWCRV